jgi:DNA-binding transcriptional ArsR family regulator
MTTTTSPTLLSTPGRILALLLDQPGATLRELARRSGKTERAIWQRVNELEEAGLLRRQRRGRGTRYYLDVPAVRRQLDREGGLLLGLATRAGETNGQTMPGGLLKPVVA